MANKNEKVNDDIKREAKQHGQDEIFYRKSRYKRELPPMMFVAVLIAAVSTGLAILFSDLGLEDFTALIAGVAITTAVFIPVRYAVKTYSSQKGKEDLKEMQLLREKDQNLETPSSSKESELTPKWTKKFGAENPKNRGRSIN